MTCNMFTRLNPLFTFVHITLMDFQDERRWFVFLKLAATTRSTNVLKTFNSMQTTCQKKKNKNLR